MKQRYIVGLAALGIAVQAGFAQGTPPGAPEDNGLKPKSDTVYLHREGSIFNDNLEGSLGVAIAANGNVIAGWEDDDDLDEDHILDFEGVWTILTSEGAFVTPDTEINSTAVPGGPITTRFLAFFRADGSPVSGWSSWGPKIKANLFGDGLGMGATSFGLGAEVAEFAAMQPGGDFPSVQLVSNSGAPVKILAGVTEAFALTGGDIRVADWDYLSNGNVLIVGESRQDADLLDKFGGDTPRRHAIFSILTPTGTVVKSETLVSETTDAAVEMWNGSAVTANGFAIRFSQGGARMRLFNNDGTPASTNINIAEVVGNPIANNGGRGEGVGFHGNGKDAYVLATSGTDSEGKRQVVISVFNANGTLRWTKNATEDTFALSLATTDAIDRVDAAIDEKGRVFVVFADQAPNLALNNANINPSTVMGRLFDATGNPMGGTFYISEKEVPSDTIQQARTPRVFWRNNLAAVAWESRNNEFFWDVGADSRADLTMAVRTFSTFTPGTVEGAGLTRIVADSPVNIPAQNNLDNWEPYAGVLGNSHFLVEANTFASGSASDQNYVVKIQPVTGGAGQLVQGFYTDAGAPFPGRINDIRQNGNPGRVGGDKRPGALNYIVGGEASAWLYPEFQTAPDRWTSPVFTEAGLRHTAEVQTFALNPTTLTPAPLMKMSDPILEGQTADYAGTGDQASRFGGDVQALDNGNFVIATDDRTTYFGQTRTPVYAVIKPNGEIVKAAAPVDPAVLNDQIWANVAPHKGGFAIRFGGMIRFFDNAGNLRGTIDQNTSGETSWDRGRGDGWRLASHINSDFVFLAGGTRVGGSGPWTSVKIAAFDARTMAAAGITEVSEPAFPAGTAGYDRTSLAVDALNRIAVAYESLPPGFAATKFQSAVRVLSYDATAKTFTPLTSSFYPFVNSVPGTVAEPSNIRTIRPSVAMTTKQILVAAKGEINMANTPALGPDSVTQLNFYTVFSHPAPAEDPTAASGLRVSTVTMGPGSVNLSWVGASGKVLIQRKVDLNLSNASTNWINLMTTTASSATLTRDLASGFYRLVDNYTGPDVIPFSAYMAPDGEPGTLNGNPTGYGIASVSLEAPNKLNYIVTYTGLTTNGSGIGANNGHVHISFDSTINGPTGGGQFVPVPSGTAGVYTGVNTILVSTNWDNLIAGKGYVNIHTAMNGGGEIRGQLLRNKYVATLNGANQVPAVTTSATGSATVEVYGNELRYNVTFNGLQGGGANLAHIHGRASTTQSNGVLFGFDTVPVPNVTSGTFSGVGTVNTATRNAIVDGLSYVNIHTPGINGGAGEIRGQLTPAP